MKADELPDMPDGGNNIARKDHIMYRSVEGDQLSIISLRAQKYETVPASEPLMVNAGVHGQPQLIAILAIFI